VDLDMNFNPRLMEYGSRDDRGTRTTVCDAFQLIERMY
jgi:hypothetical protein